MKKSPIGLILLGLIPGIVHAQSGSYYLGKTTINTGSHVVVQPHRNTVTVPAVGLENRSDKPLRCSATFSNSAQFSDTRYTHIAPGEKAFLADIDYTNYGDGPVVDIIVACSDPIRS